LLSKPPIENQVRYILIIFSVFLFSLTIISCSSSSDDGASTTSDNTTTTDDDTTTDNDTTTTTGLFVTVGDNGIILTSSDGISWTKRTSVTTNNLYGVTYGNSTFVTVGDNGTILTSSDNGTTWTNKRTSSVTTNNLYGVTYANSTFVTVGDNATILTSSDGTTWTNTSTNKRTLRYFSKAETNNLYGVTYGDGLFVVVGGDATIFTSSDGTTWTERDGLRSTWALPQYFKGVTYRKKLFVAVGRNGRILNSPDGITWKQRKSGTKYSLVGITYTSSCGKVEWKGLDAGLCKNGIFVSVGNTGRILTSFDGNWWVKRTYKLPEWLYAVTYGNGTFVTVGVNGVIITSFDGISWNKRASSNQIKSTDIASVRNTGGDLEIRCTGHGLDIGDVIRFTTTGTLPTGLALFTDYYVVAVPINNSFYVSATESGTPIVYTDEGTGKHAWQSSIALYEGTEQDDEEDTERRARASFPVPSVTIDTLHAVTYSDQL